MTQHLTHRNAFTWLSARGKQRADSEEWTMVNDCNNFENDSIQIIIISCI